MMVPGTGRDFRVSSVCNVVLGRLTLIMRRPSMVRGPALTHWCLSVVFSDTWHMFLRRLLEVSGYSGSYNRLNLFLWVLVMAIWSMTYFFGVKLVMIC